MKNSEEVAEGGAGDVEPHTRCVSRADFDAAQWLEELTGVIAEIEAKADSSEARFVDAVIEHGVIAGHPRVLAAFEAAEPEWRTMLPNVRLFVSLRLPEDRLYAGSAFAEALRLADADATEEPSRG